jgi:hypothetical protein
VRQSLTPTLSAPKGGEGEIEFSAYGFQHTPNVFHYIPVPEADHPITVAGNVEASILVFFGTKGVLSAVNFDDQLRRRTRKVDNVSADRVLPTKPACQSELMQLPP